MPAPQCFPQTATLGAALVVRCAGTVSPPALGSGRPAAASLPNPSHDGRFLTTYLASPALEIPAAYCGADQALLRTGGRADGGHLVVARSQDREKGLSRSDLRFLFTPAPEGPVWYIREIREQK